MPAPARPATINEVSTGASSVDKAFAVPKKRDLRGLRILLVDDIATTCATTSAAARALRTAGAVKITVFCAARAEPC